MYNIYQSSPHHGKLEIIREFQKCDFQALTSHGHFDQYNVNIIVSNYAQFYSIYFLSGIHKNKKILKKK